MCGVDGPGWRNPSNDGKRSGPSRAPWVDQSSASAADRGAAADSDGCRLRDPPTDRDHGADWSAIGGRRTVVVLGMLSTFGPISLDLYLPVLPELDRRSRRQRLGAQLTITACLLAWRSVSWWPVRCRTGSVVAARC